MLGIGAVMNVAPPGDGGGHGSDRSLSSPGEQRQGIHFWGWAGPEGSQNPDEGSPGLSL